MAEPAWKRQVRKELDAQFRADQRQRIRDLKAKVREAKREKAAALKRLTAACQRTAKRHAARIRKERTDARLEINAARDRLASRRKTACAKNRAKLKSKHGAAIEAREQELRDERARQRTHRIYTTPAKLKAPRKSARAESDQQVERNIEPELVPVWKAVKAKIKATPRATRTEVFEQWVHDHPARVREIVEQEAERGVQEWVAREAEERERLEGLGSLSDVEMIRRHDEVRFDEAVPF